jgi:hypothetical protein
VVVRQKPDEFVGGRIVRSDVRTLVRITGEASQGKIVDDRCTAMLARDNAVDMKWQRINGRGQVAIFATTSGSLPYSPKHALMGSVVRLSVKSHPGPRLHYSE